jgi:von Willebrand factor type A domain
MRFPAFFSLALTFAAACGSSKSSGFGDVDAAPANGGDDGGAVGSITSDGGVFDPDAACATNVEPTQRLPGAVLLVVDRSFSMNNDADDMTPRPGEPSKWDVAEPALRTLVDNLPNGLELGLEMFPYDLGCNVAQTPQVALGDVNVTRAAVKSALGQGPNGDTPTTDALKTAYGVLTTATGVGAKAVILLSDGAPNCGGSPSTVYAAVDGAHQHAGILTYVVGVPGSPYTDFSKLAVAGGTRKSASCIVDCDTAWPDVSKCCHYATSSSDFQATLTMALADIAAKLRTDCVYKVPAVNGVPPSPGQVNVVVDLGNGATLVYQSGDPNGDGWSYTDSTGTYLVLHGPICQKVLAAPSSKVEVVVGCPTQIR